MFLAIGAWFLSTTVFVVISHYLVPTFPAWLLIVFGVLLEPTELVHLGTDDRHHRSWRVISLSQRGQRGGFRLSPCRWLVRADSSSRSRSGGPKIPGGRVDGHEALQHF